MELEGRLVRVAGAETITFVGSSARSLCRGRRIWGADARSWRVGVWQVPGSIVLTVTVGGRPVGGAGL